MKKLSLIAFALILGVYFGCKSNTSSPTNSSPSTGTITGKVTDTITGLPISGAYVLYSPPDTTKAKLTFSDANGNYTFTNVPAGNVTMMASDTVYALDSTTVTVPAGGTVTQNFALLHFGASPTRNTSSLTFDGSAGVFFGTNTNSTLDFTSAVTCEAWIKATSWGPQEYSGSIVSKDGWTYGNQGYCLRCGANGTLGFVVSKSTDQEWPEATSPSGTMQLNTWYHVAGTFDGNYIRVYVNGVLAGTTQYSGQIRASTVYPLAIGGLADEGQDPRYFTGEIDEVRIWNRALSQSEIKSSMNEEIDPATQNGLAGYWRFDEGSGTTVSDLGTGNNMGTLSLASWSKDVPFK